MQGALFLLWQRTPVSLAQTMSNALWERTLVLSDAQGPRLMRALPSCGRRAPLSQCQGKREIQCLSLCLCLELTHHFHLQPIGQTGPMTLSNCQGTGHLTLRGQRMSPRHRACLVQCFSNCAPLTPGLCRGI